MHRSKTKPAPLSEDAAPQAEVQVDVCLVQMPFSAVEHPSIGLGLLKSYLTASGISSRVVHGNLLWAEDLGPDVYLLLEQTSPVHLIGEWIFAGAAFPETPCDPEGFFRLAGAGLEGGLANVLRRLHPLVDIEELVRMSRWRAQAFVDRLSESVLAMGPRIVGCSSVFQQHCASLALLRRIKQQAPDVITMLGGANCEAEMAATNHRAFPWLDFVASGEADDYFADFCATLLARGAGLKPHELPLGVYGPCHREGAAIAEPGAAPRAFISELDEIATPDYDDYFAALAGSELAGWVSPGLLVETSRGCWWGQKRHCTFCGLNGIGMSFRSKSEDRVLDEFEQLSAKHGVRRLQTVDNILDMRFFSTLLPTLAEREAPYDLFYEVKPNLKYEQLETLAAAGVRWLQPGIESLHDGVLKILDKGNTAGQNLQVLKWSQQFGILLMWGFLYGAPDECDEWYQEMAQWLPWLSHLQPPSGLHRIRYDRFSPYHSAPERFGIQLSPLRTYSHVYPLPPEQLADLVYFFEDYSDLSRGDIDPTQPGDERPGVAAVGRCIADWNVSFWGRGDDAHRVELTVRERGDQLIVKDTRPVAADGELVLEGLARQVFEACDRALPPARLTKQLRADSSRDVSWDEIRPVVAELEERKLLLAVGGRFLSLAVRQPVTPYPATEKAPVGYIPLTRVQVDCAPDSLARTALRSPVAVPIAEMFAN